MNAAHQDPEHSLMANTYSEFQRVRGQRSSPISEPIKQYIYTLKIEPARTRKRWYPTTTLRGVTTKKTSDSDVT